MNKEISRGDSFFGGGSLKQVEFLITWTNSRPMLDMMCITPYFVFLIAENTFRDLGFSLQVILALPPSWMTHVLEQEQP